MQSSTQTAPVPQGTAPSTALLRTRALTKEFRGFAAVQGVDLDVAEGSVHALVGPNGAGKTTLFNLLTGFLTPTSGTIELGDRDITGLSSEQIVHLGVARSFQITSLFDQMSLVDHVELALASPTGLGYRFWRSQKQMRQFRPRAMDLLDQVGLADRAGVLAGALAYGQKRALELALALALDPPAAAARRADRRDGHSRTSTAPSPWSSGWPAAAPWCSSTTTCTSSARWPTG